MPDVHRGFEKHQAVGWVGKVDAAAKRHTRECFVIGGGVVPAQGQLESVLACQRAMACALVAAGLGHNGQHVILERPGEWLVRGGDMNLSGTRDPVSRGGDHGIPVADGRNESSGVDCGNGRVGRSPLGVLRPVFLVAARRGFRKELVTGFGAAQNRGIR